MKILKITEKYGEGSLTLSYHPEKVSVNALLYFLLVLFFFSCCMYSCPRSFFFFFTLFLMLLKEVLPGRAIKKCHSPLWGMSRSFLQPQKNGLWWKYFKIILKENSDVICSRASCRGWRFFQAQNRVWDSQVWLYQRKARGREHIA